MKFSWQTLAMHRRTIVWLVFMVLLAYNGVAYVQVLVGLRSLQQRFASSTQEFSALADKLNVALLQEKQSNLALSGQLQSEKQKNDFFSAQIQGITGTVSALQKLKNLDPQLLEKYSKVYFLNENYVPSQLATIDPAYTYDHALTMQIHASVQPFLYQLLNAASSSTPLEIISAYRSFGTQAALKADYKVTYGSGANAFSADQGYSEHQLGTTVDFTTPKIGAGFSSQFAQSSAYQWLVQNAYKYGFILSYPKNNAYYIYEPWHWRFVGVNLATYLHNNNEQFYDLDQRVIDTFLISIFDQS